jgi:hypothetical protein
MENCEEISSARIQFINPLSRYINDAFKVYNEFSFYLNDKFINTDDPLATDVRDFEFFGKYVVDNGIKNLVSFSLKEDKTLVNGYEGRTVRTVSTIRSIIEGEEWYITGPSELTHTVTTTAFVQSAISSGIAASDAMIFKGTLGTSGTITALPTTYNIGWTYRVITAGTYAGATCEVGDLIIALVDRAGTGNVNADWTVAQTNIDGAITTAGSGLSKSGTTINHSNSVSAVTTASLLKVTYDAQGHVTGSEAIAKADITGLGIPAQDTTYNIFTGATAASAGTAGLVPIPAAGYQDTFLRGNGTWTSEPVVAADTLVLNCIAD